MLALFGLMRRVFTTEYWTFTTFPHFHLAGSTGQERFRKRALRLRGTLPQDEARRLRRSSETLRGSWR